MAYVKRIVRLANSFKIGGSCIAGKEVVGAGKYGEWVRPVSSRPTAEVRSSEYRYENNSSPKILDIIDVPLLNADPRHHQTENHVIDTTQRWAKVDELPRTAWTQILDRPASLWINSGHTKGPGYYDCITQEEAATLNNSLTLIKPDNFSVEVSPHRFTGKKTYRANFNYKGTRYNLKVTTRLPPTRFRQRIPASIP
jgi:hypothetical protein